MLSHFETKINQKSKLRFFHLRNPRWQRVWCRHKGTTSKILSHSVLLSLSLSYIVWSIYINIYIYMYSDYFFKPVAECPFNDQSSLVQTRRSNGLNVRRYHIICCIVFSILVVTIYISVSTICQWIWHRKQCLVVSIYTNMQIYIQVFGNNWRLLRDRDIWHWCHLCDHACALTGTVHVGGD